MKELQSDFSRRRARLQEEEQKLLVKKEEFDEIVHQEAERLAYKSVDSRFL